MEAASYAKLKVKMGRSRYPQLAGSVLVIFLTCCFYLPSASAGDPNSNEWKVRSGDTLYGIARAIYPGNARKQAQLRRDIIKLNPSVFANGANNMRVGVVLELPTYSTLESAEQKSSQPQARVSVKPPVPGKVTSRIATPSGSVKSTGTVWNVRSGDTLYWICRTIYPDDARKQAQLGRDIKKLNSSVFANGANNMKVGVALKLPDYVSPSSVPSRVRKPAKEVMPEKVPPKSTPRPVTSPPVIVPQPEKPAAKEKPASSFFDTKGNTVVSLGFSYGGDRLVGVTGGPDINAGSGVNLRLGYEQMLQNNSGYRASLGIQYYTLLSETNVSLKDFYLKLAYQYQANPVLYGVGVVYDAGASLENYGSAKFDAAFGPVVYLEGVGSGILSGWGVSATALRIKEKTSGTSFNASRAELYYRWKF